MYLSGTELALCPAFGSTGGEQMEPKRRVDLVRFLRQLQADAEKLGNPGNNKIWVCGTKCDKMAVVVAVWE